MVAHLREAPVARAASAMAVRPPRRRMAVHLREAPTAITAVPAAPEVPATATVPDPTRPR